MNNVSLIGRLTADPELRYTQSGIAIATFNIAIDRYTNGDGEKITDFIPINTWRGLAETVANNLTKGRLIGVTGQINVDSWESEEGTRWKTYVTAENVKFLDYPKDNNESGTQQNNSTGGNRSQGSKRNNGRGGRRA